MKVYRIYLDIETYSPGNKPSFSDRIIAISFKSLVDTEVKVLKEWEKGEKGILEEFFKYVKDMRKQNVGLELVGFNILEFDLPLLAIRAFRNGIDEIENLYETVLQYPYVIDLMQCLLPYNNFRAGGLSSLNVGLRLSIPVSEFRGDEIAKLYDAREYDRIEEHVKKDVLFIEHLDRILRQNAFFKDILSFAKD